MSTPPARPCPPTHIDGVDWRRSATALKNMPAVLELDIKGTFVCFFVRGGGGRSQVGGDRVATMLCLVEKLYSEKFKIDICILCGVESRFLRTRVMK